MKQIKIEDLILFEDDNYIVINKPPFIASLQDRGTSLNILSIARKYHEHSQLCHRLDKETSGCLIISKNEESYRHAALQFQDRKIEKVYSALVEGIHDFRKHTVDAPIYARSGGDARIDFRKGKPAVTCISSLKGYRNYTLVEASPVTGRLHQIRVHLSFIKAPIVGDRNYGGHPFYLSAIKPKYKSGKWQEEQPLIKRVALHARSVGFESVNGDKIKVEAPYPKDFQALIRQLDRYG